MYRWLLEQDCDGEIHTLPTTDDAAIERVVSMFDGQHTFYCCLTDTADESCLWCVGEPNRRLFEGRFIEGGKVRQFVLRHRISTGDDTALLRYGSGPSDMIAATESEIFTPTEALSILQAFHGHREIPNDCEIVSGVRLFGSNSFEV